MFVTVFYGILNTLTGEVEYVNAGHNPPYLLSSSGLNKLDLTAGIALGVLEDINFNSKTIKLKPGEKLFLYTDGVTEAFNKEMTAYGENKLKIFLNQRLAQPIKTIIKESLEDVNVFADGAPRSDDITLMAVAFNG
jgi:sigma-B regulation protein RsbU (phosphoserine phosphatase)